MLLPPARIPRAHSQFTSIIEFRQDKNCPMKWRFDKWNKSITATMTKHVPATEVA